jgi:hypothetical protein
VGAELNFGTAVLTKKPHGEADTAADSMITFAMLSGFCANFLSLATGGHGSAYYRNDTGFVRNH